MNVTEPVGTPTAGATAVTVVLSVTACPAVEGFGVEVRVVVVCPLFTVCVTTAEVLTRSEEHTSELQSLAYLVCRLLLEKKKTYVPRSVVHPRHVGDQHRHLP